MQVKEWLDNYGKNNFDIAKATRQNKVTPKIEKLKEEKDLLEMALDTLPTQDKELIILRFIENKSYDKIARAMGYAKSTIFEREKRIVKKLQELLND